MCPRICVSHTCRSNKRYCLCLQQPCPVYELCSSQLQKNTAQSLNNSNLSYLIMETQIFVVSSSLSFMTPSTEKNDAIWFFLLQRRVSSHSSSNCFTNSNFRNNVIKGSLLKAFCQLNSRIFCRILLVNYQMSGMDGHWKQSCPSTRVCTSDVM